MIVELDKNNKELIEQLEHYFHYVLMDVLSDLENNPFSNYLLYIDNGNIKGYINYYLMYDRAEIANFDVLIEYQNQGIGTKLLEYLIRKLEGKVINISLEVRCDNEKAISLYKKFNFNFTYN